MSVVIAENLGKTFSTGIRGTKVTALKDLSFSVSPGEVFGLLGPNGAGKTTALKIFMGLLYPSWGRAEILGRPPWDVSMKGKIGFLPEGPYFYEYLTGEEFLHFYGQLFDLDGKVRRQRMEELLSLVGLSDFRKLKLRRYSKGMLQRIGLAQALINDPELVVLDEPMSGLDPVGRKELSDIILGLKEEGKTIFFSSHILADVQKICDRIAIIHRGSLVYLGGVKDFLGKRPIYFEVALEGVSPPLLAQLKEYSTELNRSEDKMVLRVDKAENLDRVMADAHGSSAPIRSIVPIHPSLEELFVELIRKSDKG